MTFVGGSWKVNKTALVIAQGTIGTLYLTSTGKNTLTTFDAGVSSKLWHYRLGHMSEKGMKVLLSKGRKPELKTIDHNLCES